MLETSRPGEDASDWVRARRVALLVLAVVPRHGTVRRLSLDRLAVGTHEHARHQAKGAVTCGAWEENYQDQGKCFVRNNAFQEYFMHHENRDTDGRDRVHTGVCEPLKCFSLMSS